VLLCGVRSELAASLERSPIAALMRPGHVFLERPVRLTSTQEAMRFARGLCPATIS
jgi:hypothetical protein